MRVNDCFKLINDAILSGHKIKESQFEELDCLGRIVKLGDLELKIIYSIEKYYSTFSNNNSTLLEYEISASIPTNDTMESVGDMIQKISNYLDNVTVCYN